MLKNKKAIIEDWIPLFISIIVMVLVIVFLMAIKAGVEKKPISFDKEEINAYQNLITYLRSSYINENDNKMNIADAIIFNENNFDENYNFDDVKYMSGERNKLDLFTEEFFNKTYGSGHWSLVIKDDQKLLREHGLMSRVRTSAFSPLKCNLYNMKLPIPNKDLDISLIVCKK